MAFYDSPSPELKTFQDRAERASLTEHLRASRLRSCYEKILEHPAFRRAVLEWSPGGVRS